jgi:ubiquinone/menaquinone biosynthesis C-methylase UbiE
VRAWPKAAAMGARNHAYASGTDSTELFQAVMNGREHTPEAWYDYLDRFHTALPFANETLFTNLRTVGDRSSYEVLARAAAAVGGRDVLDVGCGNGCLVNELLEAFPRDTQFTGIDMCAAEIDAARTTFAAERRVRFERVRAETLPFGDQSFDTVTAHQTLNFFPDPRPALAEIFRVLRPGGALVFAQNRALPEELNYVRLLRAGQAVAKQQYPKMIAPVDADRRIYHASGIRDLLKESAKFDLERMKHETFSVGAMMTPETAASTFARIYIIASIPSNEAIFAAIVARAREIAAEDRSDVIDLELPFHLVEVRKPVLAPV